MTERIDLTVRVRSNEPFAAQIRAAMEGLTSAIFSLESIVEDHGCTDFLQSDYGRLIWTTLGIETDGLLRGMTKAFKDAGREISAPVWRE